MPLLRQPLPAMYGGVSQQSAVIRSPTQCEEAINCHLSVAEGAAKRPPLEVVRRFSLTDSSNSYFYWFTARDEGRYLLEIPGDGTLRVYRLQDGQFIGGTIAAELNAYLTAPNAKDSFRAFTINDRTIIVNTTVTVAMTADLESGVITKSVQTLQDKALDTATNNQIFQVVGDAANPFDTYYTKKVGDRFIEWLKPGIPYRIDATTMPIYMELDLANSAFVTGRPVWADRIVGDEQSNKLPSFVGKKIHGVFFIGDRLSFLSGQHYCLSETGEYYNFWRTTVTDVLDTDRIDGTLASDDASFLFYAKPVAKSMILFAEKRQFSFDWDGAVTPGSLSATPATAYPMNTRCEPATMGQEAYFTSEVGDHTVVREMFVQEDTVSNDAADLTAHAPSYIPAGVFALEGAGNFDMLFAASSLHGSKLWVHSSMWNQNQRMQSAWGTWEFGYGDDKMRIVSIKALDEYLYMVYTYALDDGSRNTFIGRVSLKLTDPGLAKGRFNHPVKLDHLERVTGVYDAFNDRTYFDCQFPVGQNMEALQLVRSLGSGSQKGTVLREPEWIAKFAGTYEIGNAYPRTFSAGPSDVYRVYITGKHDYEVFLGQTYVQDFVPSEYHHDDQGKAMLTARIQLRTLTVAFQKTGFFYTKVEAKGVDEVLSPFVPYDELQSTYAGRTVGDEWFLFNAPQVVDGKYRFPIYAPSTDVRIHLLNDSYLPSRFVAGEYEALVTTRARR